MPERYTSVHDPRVLRAIAHPTRTRILGELSAAGTLRAADVARELGIPANQASFHLRQLAKYGLVEEAPEAARDQRDRVWRATSERGLSLDLQALEQAPGGPAAVAVWRRNQSAWAQHVVASAYTRPRDPSAFRAVTEQVVRLTKAEAERFAGELDDVLQRWGARFREHGPGTDGDTDAETPGDARRAYLYFSVLQPHPETAGEGGDGGDGAVSATTAE